MMVWSGLGRRRSAATTAALTALLAVLLAILQAVSPASSAVAAAPTAPAGLRPLATAAEFHLGAAVDADALDDTAYRRLLEDNVTMVSTTDELSFAVVQPEQGTFDFSRAERVVDFAVEAGLTVRGHDLIAVGSLPAWITNGTWSADELTGILTEHVTTVISHFEERNPGVIIQWDVVANAVLPDGTPRPSPPQDVIGDSWIGAVFTAARTADPTASLFYDDFYDDFSIVQESPASGAAVGGANAERTTCDAVVKCGGVRTMVTSLLDAQVPIDGVGFQAHLFSPEPVDFDQFSQWAVDLGLDWAITEFDVPLPATEVTDAATLVYQAEEYGNVIDACLNSPACDTLVTWGITDRIPTSTVTETGGAFAGSLPFDANDVPKPAVDVLATALADHAVAVPDTTTATTAPPAAAVSEPAATSVVSSSNESSPLVAVAIGLGALAAVALIVVALRRRR